MSLITELSDAKGRLNALADKSSELRGIFDVPMKEKRLQELAMQSENPDLWNRPVEMQKLNKERALLSKTVDSWAELKNRVEDAKVLLDMAVEANDEATFLETKTEILALRRLRSLSSSTRNLI